MVRGFQARKRARATRHIKLPVARGITLPEKAGIPVDCAAGRTAGDPLICRACQFLPVILPTRVEAFGGQTRQRPISMRAQQRVGGVHRPLRSANRVVAAPVRQTVVGIVGGNELDAVMARRDGAWNGALRAYRPGMLRNGPRTVPCPGGAMPCGVWRGDASLQSLREIVATEHQCGGGTDFNPDFNLLYALFAAILGGDIVERNRPITQNLRCNRKRHLLQSGPAVRIR